MTVHSDDTPAETDGAVTPPNEMVERVARAISGAPFPSAASYRRARAAIAAMREPTRAMHDAAMQTLVQENGGIEYAPVVGWRAMIDAALTPQQSDRTDAPTPE